MRCDRTARRPDRDQKILGAEVRSRRRDRARNGRDRRGDLVHLDRDQAQGLKMAIQAAMVRERTLGRSGLLLLDRAQRSANARRRDAGWRRFAGRRSGTIRRRSRRWTAAAARARSWSGPRPPITAEVALLIRTLQAAAIERSIDRRVRRAPRRNARATANSLDARDRRVQTQRVRSGQDASGTARKYRWRGSSPVNKISFRRQFEVDARVRFVLERKTRRESIG